jgi:cytochrome c oxidase cbb3-type subunit III
MKKLFLFTLALGFPLASFAQAASDTKSFLSDPFNHPMLPFYLIITLIGVVIVLIGFVAFAIIRVLNTLSESVERDKAAQLGVAFKPKPSWWQKFSQTLNASVPVEEEESIEMDHNYDGIRELDNHLPPWWTYLFYATIVWSVIYVFVYHFTGSLPLPEKEYQNELAEAELVKKNYLATQPKVSIDEGTLTYSADAGIIAKGKEIYSINCSPCHKPDGGGSIGPNLTDAYWIHGGDVKNIYGIIKSGVPEKGMVSWAAVLSPEQIRDVAFFVVSMQGSNPPGGKAPQGTMAQPAAPETKSDSTKTQASL